MWIDLIFQHIYLHLGKERIGDDFHFHFNMKALIFLCLSKTWSALTLLLEVQDSVTHRGGSLTEITINDIPYGKTSIYNF